MKEGGTSLHKTFRGINLAFKGLKDFLSSTCMGLRVGRTVDILGGTWES